MMIRNPDTRFELLDNLEFFERNDVPLLALTPNNLDRFINGAWAPIFLDIAELDSLSNADNQEDLEINNRHAYEQSIAWQSVLSGMERTLNPNDHLYNPHFEKHRAQSRSIFELFQMIDPTLLRVYINETNEFSEWPRLVVETSQPTNISSSKIPISIGRGLHDFTAIREYSTESVLKAVELHSMDLFDLITYLATINYPQNLILDPAIRSHQYYRGGKTYQQLNWSEIAYNMDLPLPTSQKDVLMRTNNLYQLFKEIKNLIRPKDLLGLEDVPIIPEQVIKPLANLRESYWCMLFKQKEYDPQIIDSTIIQTPRVVLPTVYEWYAKLKRDDKKMAQSMLYSYPDLFINIPITAYLETSIKLKNKSKAVLLRYNSPMQNCDDDACESCALQGFC